MRKVMINGKTVTIDSKGYVQPTAPGKVDREKTKIAPAKPIKWRCY